MNSLSRKFHVWEGFFTRFDFTIHENLKSNISRHVWFTTLMLVVKFSWIFVKFRELFWKNRELFLTKIPVFKQLNGKKCVKTLSWTYFDIKKLPINISRNFTFHEIFFTTFENFESWNFTTVWVWHFKVVKSLSRLRFDIFSSRPITTNYRILSKIRPLENKPHFENKPHLSPPDFLNKTRSKISPTFKNLSNKFSKLDLNFPNATKLYWIYILQT